MNLRAFRDAGGTYRDSNARGRHYALSKETCVLPCTPSEQKRIVKGGHKPCQMY
jgi:hypothetical protein